MRKHCPTCGYPVRTCLCHAVKPVCNCTEVIIIQHPKEANHAKNTVRLLDLTLNNMTVWVGKTAADFAQLCHILNANPISTAVIYPSPDSQELTEPQGQNAYGIERIILIDASWKQAFGIWQHNDWLNRYPFYRLPLKQKGQYFIRHSPLEFSLSTLEAVAYSLQRIEQLDTAPLLNLLSTFSQQWQGFLPSQQ